MEWSFLFFLNSALLGVGLAMDAFSVSMANGLHDPGMSRKMLISFFSISACLLRSAGTSRR